MSLQLADVLIELSDPATLLEFRRDPSVFLSKRALSPDENAALLASSYNELRKHVQSTPSEDPTQQFNRRRQTEIIDFGPMEIDPQVEIHPPQDQVTVSGRGLSFIDANGVRYVAHRNEDSSARAQSDGGNR
jgi:hypothetical protein